MEPMSLEAFVAFGFPNQAVDLSKFFDLVHHQSLLGRLAEHVDDGRVVKLIRQMLKANIVLPEPTRTLGSLNVSCRCVTDGRLFNLPCRSKDSSCCSNDINLRSRMWAHKSGSVRSAEEQSSVPTRHRSKAINRRSTS